jgi:hypothetical protein
MNLRPGSKSEGCGLDEIILKIRRSIGSILHDFYNLAERTFKKVAMDINGSYEDSERWHKALLFKMTVPIKGVRPALISEELAADLDEYFLFDICSETFMALN